MDWNQDKLPVRYDGIRLRIAISLVLPSYVASTATCQELVAEILGTLDQLHVIFD